MKPLILFLAAQLSAVLFVESYHDFLDATPIISGVCLLAFSGYFIFNFVNYKK